eukprot:m.351046 g.351046  ORF g.351046 m.351046 type:complete len:456 (+) comp19895_c0_seq11:117-1484(+)
MTRVEPIDTMKRSGLLALVGCCVMTVLPVVAYNCSHDKYVPEHPPVWHEGCDTIKVVSTDPDLDGLWAKMHMEPQLRELWPQSMPASVAVSYRHHGGQAHLYRMKTTTPGHDGEHHWVIAYKMFDPHWWYAAPATSKHPVGSTGWVTALQDGHPPANLTVVCSDNIISTIDLGGSTVVTERIISESPRITVFDNVFTEEEGQSVIDRYSKDLQEHEPGPLRQSLVVHGTSWDLSKEDLAYVERVVSKRIATLRQTEFQKFEDLVMMGYDECRHVTPHWDILRNKTGFQGLFDMGLRPNDRGVHGQRHRQSVIYLNTVNKEDGGATMFNILGLAVQPKAGRALNFANRDASFEADARIMHTARPLYKGRKFSGSFVERVVGPVYPRRLGRDKREFDARVAAKLAAAEQARRSAVDDDDDDGYDDYGDEYRGDYNDDDHLQHDHSEGHEASTHAVEL